MDWQQFRSPGAAYSIHPFWFWNGDMEEQEIIRQIEEMADKGVRGFFICARQGMQISYLSKTWFDKVSFAIKAAKERNMQVWLYDEYPYPSGIAGGEVTLLHPDAKHQTLAVTEHSVAGGSQIQLELPWARILAAKAVPVKPTGEKDWEHAVDLSAAIGNFQADPVFQKTGLTTYNQKRFFTYRTVYRLDWEAPAGEWLVLIFQEKEIENFKYYGTFVDPCHREAMQSFIRLTHDRYEAYIGEDFGETVKGMFTDEIGLLGKNPWSPQLEAYFLKRNGYSLKDHLQALVCSDYPNAPKIRYDYYQSLHLLLCESYHEQIHDWCEERSLQYVAEVPSMRMTTQRYSHVPGGDSAHEKLGRSLDWILRRYALSFRDNPKMTSSIARQLGRERVLNESFHSVGWSMNLQDAKWMIDRLAALGTNFYNFHAFFYTIDGMTQHDAPPSQFYQNPYWRHFRQLGDYTARMSYLMSKGTADIRIAVLDPTTTLWSHMANPMHHFEYAGYDAQEKKRLDQLKGDWQSIHVHLLKSRRDFDHLDPELLAEAELTEEGTIRIGKASYSVLILPPMANLEQRAWSQVKAFLQAGGTVIAYGLLPYEAIEAEGTAHLEAVQTFGVPASPHLLYWRSMQAKDEQEACEGLEAIELQLLAQGQGAAYFIPRSGGEPADHALKQLSQLLDELLPRPVTLDFGREADGFLMQSRYLDDQDYAVFVSNQESAVWDTRLTIDPGQIWPELKSPYTIDAELVDVESGAHTPLQINFLAEGLCTIPLTFDAYQSRLIRITTSASASAPQEADVWRWNLDADAGDWRQSALSPNALRFDKFRLSVGESAEAQEAVWVQAKTFIDQCADLAQQQNLPISFSQVFGVPMKTKIAYPLACRYSVSFYIEQLPTSCSLLMDQSAIAGEWTLHLNDVAVTKADFTSQLVYDHANCLCSIGHALRQGWNNMHIDVHVEQDWHGIVDALYLYGDFGVRFDETSRPVVTRAPENAESLRAGRYYAGYPYYAGDMSFKRAMSLSSLPSAAMFEVMFPGWDVHDSVEVLVNGQSLGLRPWSPYVWSGQSAILREGENEIEVRVTGTLIGLLEGKYFDYEQHRVIDI
ncbi:glycosyl hydrolase [Paenibacillus aestuarii]|uniref:Glycosyl hydrolase n=1 Tax=Paenibacillus aestuarii TaxID=516965 RepID=A0ABW0K8S2_9BACL|nr:glycosyl hydrolase [Paenibacillus aestuarii]